MHDPPPRTCHKLQQTHPPQSDHSNIWQGEQNKKLIMQFYPLSCHFLPLKNRKFVPIHVMKAYRASRGIAPLILNPGNLPSRREPRYLLDKRLGGLDILEKGKYLAPACIRTLDCPTCTLVTSDYTTLLISSLLGSHTFLSTLFSNTLTLSCSLK